MEFASARCVTCGVYVFNPKLLVAFQVSNVGLKRVDLKGQEPWCGIRCICLKCVEAIDGFVMEAVS